MSRNWKPWPIQDNLNTSKKSPSPKLQELQLSTCAQSLYKFSLIVKQLKFLEY